MKEYIDKAALMLHIAGVKIHLKGDSEWITGYRDALQAVWETVQKFPAADVVERKRGEWVRKEDECCYWFECSVCGEEPAKLHGNYDFFSNFCPNCGCQMVGDEDGRD